MLAKKWLNYRWERKFRKTATTQSTRPELAGGTYYDAPLRVVRTSHSQWTLAWLEKAPSDFYKQYTYVHIRRVSTDECCNQQRRAAPWQVRFSLSLSLRRTCAQANVRKANRWNSIKYKLDKTFFCYRRGKIQVPEADNAQLCTLVYYFVFFDVLEHLTGHGGGVLRT